MNAYDNGYNAGYAGLPASSNPYPSDSGLFTEWDEGHLAGCNDIAEDYDNGDSEDWDDDMSAADAFDYEGDYYNGDYGYDE